MRTQEEYMEGTLTSIRDNFRVFDSMEEGVKGYFEFIQLKRYRNLQGIRDPQEYLETIRADGYATSFSYVEDCMKVIRQYELTRFDELIKAFCPMKDGKFVGKIIDPFHGSGTLGVCCEKLNLQGNNIEWTGIELEQRWCDVAKERLEKVRGKGND